MPTKEQIHIRLDADIVDHFRRGGKGWPTRQNDALRQAVFRQAGGSIMTTIIEAVRTRR